MDLILQVWELWKIAFICRKWNWLLFQVTFEKVENAQRWIRWVFMVTKQDPYSTALGMCTMNIPIWFDCSCTNGSPGWYSSRILVSKMDCWQNLLGKNFNKKGCFWSCRFFLHWILQKIPLASSWKLIAGTRNLFQRYINYPATSEREASSRKSPTRL